MDEPLFQLPVRRNNEAAALYNVYCDETCHLEHDGKKAMVLGAVWCPKAKIREVNERIREIKRKHGIPAQREVKWTKVSPSKAELYRDLIDYFFDDDDLHFRCLVIPDKSALNHEAFGQTHDEWYYKMYFDMLKTIFRTDGGYDVYVDIKDTNSADNVAKLADVCANDVYDFNHKIVRRIQPIRSHEVQLMQIVDILVGAVGYRHNYSARIPGMSQTKIDLVNRIVERSGYRLTRSTLLGERKFNIFVWDAGRRS